MTLSSSPSLIHFLKRKERGKKRKEKVIQNGIISPPEKKIRKQHLLKNDI